MSSAYKCDRCGIISDQRKHVCQPQEVSRAEFCGFDSENISHMCDEMAENMNFQCDTCGRPSEKPGMLCSPKPIR